MFGMVRAGVCNSSCHVASNERIDYGEDTRIFMAVLDKASVLHTEIQMGGVPGALAIVWICG